MEGFNEPYCPHFQGPHEFHGHFPHGPHGHSPYGPHGHSPHGPHGHSPHGPHEHSPHGPHGPHGHYGGLGHHGPHWSNRLHGHHGHNFPFPYIYHVPHGTNQQNPSQKDESHNSGQAKKNEFTPSSDYPQGGYIPQNEENYGYYDNKDDQYNSQDQGYNSQEGQNYYNQDLGYNSIKPQENNIPQQPTFNPQQQQIPYYPPIQQPSSPQSQPPYVAPNSIHEHPLNFVQILNALCTICKQSNGDQPGYQCGQCEVALCMNCSKRLFFGDKKTILHPHPLELKYRVTWRCQICNILYQKTSSFFCKQCDFDVCSSCYVPY